MGAEEEEKENPNEDKQGQRRGALKKGA